MAFRPDTRQNVQIVEQRNEENWNVKKKKFFLQVTFVLDGLASMEKVPFEKFDSEFFARTKSRFEESFSEFLENEDRHWNMEQIISKLSATMLKIPFTVDHDESGDIVFIPTPRTSRKLPVSALKLPPPSRKKPGNIPVKVLITREASRREEGETVERETVGTVANREEAEEEKRTIHWTDVHDMFSRPYWPWLNEHFRAKRRQKYLNFLQFSAQKPHGDKTVMRDAKNLSDEFWNYLRFYPHVIYLLHKLGIEKPDGFNSDDVKQLIESQIPNLWRRNCPNQELSLEHFLVKVVDLIETNLIMRCDKDDYRMLKVNKIINSLGFFEIRDPEISMIYQYVSSTQLPKTTRSIHTFMCDDYPGWSQKYDMVTGKHRIWEICTSQPKMFSSENDQILAKPHTYRIPIPMHFSICIV